MHAAVAGHGEAIEHLGWPHAVVGPEYPHGNPDVFQLVVDIVAGVIHRVDHIQHPKKVGTSPDDLLLA